MKNYIKNLLQERLVKLYPMENPEALFDLFLEKWLKRLLVILAAASLLAVAVLFSNQEEDILKQGNQIERPGYGEEEQQVQIKAEFEDTKMDITLQIAPEKYTFEEFKAVVEEAIPILEKSLLGTNPSFDEIAEDLELPDMISGTPVEILWESDREEIVSREGKINAEEAAEEGSLVSLTAVFRYEEYKMSHEITLLVKPPKLTVTQRLQKLLLDEIEKVFTETEEENQVQLPVEIEGISVFYEEEKQEKTGVIPFFILVGIFLWAAAMKEEIENAEKKREKQLLMDYPELVSQFTLLLSAGMTVRGAWKRLIEQYEKQQKENKKERRYVYEEMTLTWREMQNGISEAEAVSRFGARIRLALYMKFSTMLSQNIRKGSRGLLELLQTEGKLAFEERKETAKQLGEEAGTKLLLPMMIMLGIVLVVILVPAFLSF